MNSAPTAIQKRYFAMAGCDNCDNCDNYGSTHENVATVATVAARHSENSLLSPGEGHSCQRPPAIPAATIHDLANTEIPRACAQREGRGGAKFRSVKR